MHVCLYIILCYKCLYVAMCVVSVSLFTVCFLLHLCTYLSFVSVSLCAFACMFVVLSACISLCICILGV